MNILRGRASSAAPSVLPGRISSLLSCRVCAEVSVGGFDSDCELAGIASCLGEDEAALDRGQCGGGEPVGFGSAIEFPALLH